jgi:hypothetical protein
MSKLKSSPGREIVGQTENTIKKEATKIYRNLLILLWSGREDLNLRPPEPHSGALPDCATSRPDFKILLKWSALFNHAAIFVNSY